VASGSPLLTVFAFYDPSSSSWRTSQPSAGEASTVYSATWPSSGMTQYGAAFALRMWERLTAESGSSCSPICRKVGTSWQLCSAASPLFRTPLVSDAHGAQNLDKRMGRGRQVGLNDQVVTLFPLQALDTKPASAR
jgi:hypothetical protein